MKKILNEWRSFINETERKHPKRKTRGEYDRAATDYVRQRTQSKNDPRSELRYRISNITYHAADPRTSGVRIDSLVGFVNASRLKKKLIRDLKLIHYLFDPKSETKYQARSGRGSLIFNDTGPLSDDSAGLIRSILEKLNESPVTGKPSEEELEEVFKYHIAPNNESLWPDQEPEPATDRFSHMLNISPEMKARMAQMAAARPTRKRIKRKK